MEPALPPKTCNKHPSPYHDTPKNNNPIFLPITPSSEPEKSIDQILDDLDKEKVEGESRSNVKRMVERFNAFSEEEVVLRREKEQEKPVSRHSDDLNELLEKLGKITVAPTMEPGVTSSLASPPVSDEEVAVLIGLATHI